MSEKTHIRSVGSGVNQRGIRAHNERLILSVLQRHGAMSGQEIARKTALSAQTISVILRKLESDNFLLRGHTTKGKVGKPFEAKAQGLPAGTYSDSCKGCRVEGEELGHPKKLLVCASCTGGSAAAGKVSAELDSCESGFANEGGALVCDKAAEMAAEVEAAVEGGGDGGESEGDGKEL